MSRVRKLIALMARILADLTPIFFSIVRFTIPAKSETILVMSQSDDRYYKSVSSSSTWSFNFKLFKAGVPGQSRPIASSDTSYSVNRSNTMRIDLEPGEYVVHVRKLIYTYLPI